MASPGTYVASSGPRARRRAVEARLAQVDPPPAGRRSPPPEGRLSADEHAVTRLRAALADLGPVFAGFGRYLSSRIDLLPRREALELSAIPDRATPMTAAQVDACVAEQLGTPLERRFFEFDRTACDATLWTERHRAWLAPGVPVLVTMVRPDAAEWLASDVPLLPLLNPWVDVPPDGLAAAIDDFVSTLQRRLDQTLQVSAFATLAADASAHGGFSAPACYRDHCAPGILTIAKPAGATFDDILADESEPDATRAAGEQYAQRLASAWLRQALLGRVVPFDFGPRDIVADGDRLVLIGGAFEPHTSGERSRFLNYVNAVAADDADAAAAWLVDVAAPEASNRREEELLRRLRQAVPFRDGEWSGDDRLAEHLLVQWRMAREAAWPLTPHHLHLYRGLLAATGMAARLAPHEDALLGALRDERLRMSLAQAQRVLDPREVGATLDRLLQDMVHLPQKLDNVLTLAAEGRLRVKLHVPDGDETRHVRNRTILLVATLVALAGLASVARQFAPAFGPDVERLAAVALLALGGWLLVVAARM
jgi:predicted unusual protein kinase regulating ubiquinone biosynthesis (AarF/ABC1/UbiB family)